MKTYRAPIPVITAIFILATFCTPMDWHKIAYGQKFIPMPLNSNPDFKTGVFDSKEEAYGLNGHAHPIHYMFIPADKNHETAPFIFWHMGGPGASVLSFWYYFNGPLRRTMAGIPKNPYAFNTFANIVVLEYPYGIGYSVDRAKKASNIPQ